MKIHHYNSETLEFIAEGNADADPLEAGRFLIPAHSTNTPPPIAKAGKTRHFAAGAWEYRDIPIPPEPPAPTPEEIKAAANAPILAQIATIEARQGRSLREAVLNKPVSAARLVALDAQIEALRAQLVV